MHHDLTKFRIVVTKFDLLGTSAICSHFFNFCSPPLSLFGVHVCLFLHIVM